MSESGMEISDNEYNGPAKNLRKNSGRNLQLDQGQIVSDKTGCKKNAKERKPKPAGQGQDSASNNPSVRDWLNKLGNQDIEEQDDVSHDDEEVSEHLSEFGDGERHRPFEDWAEEDGDTGAWGFNPRQRADDQTHEESTAVNADGSKPEEAEPDFDNMDFEDMKSLVKEMYYAVNNMGKAFKGFTSNRVSAVKKIDVIKDQMVLVKKTVIKHDRCLETVGEKINQIELRSMRSNLLISGIEETKAENCKEKANNFFKQQMKINDGVKIKVAFRIGDKSRDNRPMVVILPNASVKALVYKHAKNLKDTEFYINDQLPEKQTEEQRLQKTKLKINKNLIDAQQQDLEWKRGRLHVDGRPYEPKVKQTTCAEVLEMNEIQIRQALAYKVYESEKAIKNKSEFIGFAARAYSVKDVLTVYKQMRYRFKDATHIMCAYRIMDPDVIHMQDCVDDGELGAGRRLLLQLIEGDHTNVMVFVVRHHKGPKIGPIRFSMITDVAKNALNAIPSTLEALIRGDKELRSSANFSLYTNQQQRANFHRARGASTAAKTLSYSARVTPIKQQKQETRKTNTPRVSVDV